MRETKVYYGFTDNLKETYKKILDDGYELKILNKKTDKKIYDYFTPDIKNTFFWTFDVKNEENLKKVSKDIIAAICLNYYTNIFTKDSDEIFVFETGIILSISKENIIRNYMNVKNIEEIELLNLSEKGYFARHKYTETDIEEDFSKIHKYAFVLSLYKKIYINKLIKEISISKNFDKINFYIKDFREKIYDVDITNKDGYIVQTEEILGIEEDFNKMQNDFDKLFVEEKKEDKKQLIKYILIGGIFIIIIGFIIINFWNK